MICTCAGHITHSIFLIASNAAALLPAYSSLRSKVFYLQKALSSSKNIVLEIYLAFTLKINPFFFRHLQNGFSLRLVVWQVLCIMHVIQAPCVYWASIPYR